MFKNHLIKTTSIIILTGILLLGIKINLFTQTDKDTNIRPENISNESMLIQEPKWYKSSEAIRIADNVLTYQLSTGGWDKNIDMLAKLSNKYKKLIITNNKNNLNSTLDNEATTTQIRFLAKVYKARKYKKAYDGLIKGINFLLEAQYDNGGWPQDYPKPQGYHAHITYNDNAMINTLRILHGIATGKDKDFDFLADKDLKEKAKKAVDKGIDCILKTQIKINGKLTGWCAQHDEKTLQPAEARSYEKISISGLEGVEILKFLMEIDNPTPQIIDAIQSGVAWFNKVTLKGIKMIKFDQYDDDFDFVIEKDPNAEPIWARFYEIGTNRPIFSGRDGIVKYDSSQIERERRYNYRWYVTAPALLINEYYPTWQVKWAPNDNVLEK